MRMKMLSLLAAALLPLAGTAAAEGKLTVYT